MSKRSENCKCKGKPEPPARMTKEQFLEWQFQQYRSDMLDQESNDFEEKLEKERKLMEEEELKNQADFEKRQRRKLREERRKEYEQRADTQVCYPNKKMDKELEQRYKEQQRLLRTMRVTDESKLPKGFVLANSADGPVLFEENLLDQLGRNVKEQ